MGLTEEKMKINPQFGDSDENVTEINLGSQSQIRKGQHITL